MKASDVGGVALRLLQEHNEEIGRLCARLCALVPTGATLLISIDVTGVPRLVTADGKPVGQQSELILITRPATFIAQPLTAKPRA